MHQVRVPCVMLVALLPAMRPTPDDLADLMSRVHNATEATYASVSRARGEGTFETVNFVKGGHAGLASRETIRTRARFSMAFDRPKNVVQLRFQPIDGAPPEYEAIVLLYDGRLVYQSLFTPNILPLGARGEIYEPFEGGFPMHLFPATFDSLAGKGLFLEKVQEDWAKKQVEPRVDEEKGLRVIRAEFPGPLLEELWIDPARDHNFVRYLLKVPQGSVDWKRELASVHETLYVRKFERRDESYDERGEVTRSEYSKIEFDKFEPNVEVPPEVFSVNALGLPKEAQVSDKRVNPPRIVSLGIPETDVNKLEQVIGELPKARGVVALPAPAELSDIPLQSRRAIWPGVATTIGIMAVGLGIYLRFRWGRSPRGQDAPR